MKPCIATKDWRDRNGGKEENWEGIRNVELRTMTRPGAKVVKITTAKTKVRMTWSGMLAIQSLLEADVRRPAKNAKREASSNNGSAEITPLAPQTSNPRCRI